MAPSYGLSSPGVGGGSRGKIRGTSRVIVRTRRKAARAKGCVPKQPTEERAGLEGDCDL